MNEVDYLVLAGRFNVMNVQTFKLGTSTLLGRAADALSQKLGTSDFLSIITKLSRCALVQLQELT